MGHTIRRIDYFYTTVHDRPGEALGFLTALAELGVNLLAFTAIPSGMLQTQLIGKSFRSWWLDAVPVGCVRRVPGRCSGLETGKPI